MASNMMPGPEPEEPDNCRECEGTGASTCETCDGTGSIDQRIGGIPTSGVIECPDCKGSGIFEQKCENCHGTGYYEFDFEEEWG